MAKKISHKRIAQARGWLQQQEVLKVTPALKKAAVTFDLDLKNPQHRQRLLCVLAHLVFADGKRGRPRNTWKWDGQLEWHLGKCFYELRQEQPSITIAAGAKIIKRQCPEFADTTESSMRKRLGALYAWVADVEEN
jgi:hypothetical protein